MVKPNFDPSHGGLATSRYDFEKHIEGTAFRHTADQIDTSPPINISGLNYSTVEDTLEAISGYIITAATNGQGFTTIGDGYDTYHASDSSSPTPPNSSFPYDSSIPALNVALDDLLNNTNNPLHHRIRDGGIVIIKAGTYKFTGTVNVPPGIMLFGEAYGTKIANATSGMPLFRVKVDSSRSSDSSLDPSKFMFAKETLFYNLTIADNFIEPLFLGDSSYKNPINTSVANPLIIQEPGSNLRLQNCKFIGKPVIVSSNVTSCTSMVVGTDTTIPATTGSHLKIDNCFIDGFSETCQFKTTGYTNDTFICVNNKIRNYGNLNTDSSGQLNNTFFNINRCNIIISDNYTFGAIDGFINNLLYIDNIPTFGTLTTQPRVIISGNSGIITAGTPILVAYNPGTDGENVMVSMASGNNYGPSLVSNFVNFGTEFDMNGDMEVGNDGYAAKIKIFSGSSMQTNIGSSVNINGALSIFGTTSLGIINVTGGPITHVVSATDPVVFLINTTSGVVTISLPVSTPGQLYYFKDVMGTASTNNIFLAPSGSDTIEGINAIYTISENFKNLIIIGNGNATGWSFLS